MYRTQLEFVGPLPPPVHGFAWVNQQMLQGLEHLSHVRVNDRAPRQWRWIGRSKVFGVLPTLGQCLVAAWRCIKSRPTAFYLGCSGGLGMLLDAPYVLLARCLNVPVYVHHHAFSYLNNPTLLTRLCMGQLRTSQHIVLGTRMGDLLCRVYAVPLGHVAVLSNAAFLDQVRQHSRTHSVEMTVGFLSNITPEKGIFDFFDLARVFHQSGARVQFVIAGPVASDIQARFNARLRELPNVRHLGALYGDAKTAFFSSLDVLAFPTRYANEAEPVTIHEALRAGVPVIANDRGCIGSLLDDSCGRVVTDADDFVTAATSWLKKLAASDDALQKYKQAAILRFEALHAEHSKNLSHILGRIATGQPLKAIE